MQEWKIVLISSEQSKVAVVTGGNRGLGIEICKKLSKIGYKVILTARKIEDGVNAVKKIGNKKIDHFLLDVTSEKNIHDLRDYIVKKYGRLDVLINNAGILIDDRSYGAGKKSDIFDISADTLRETLEVNAIAPFLLCKELAPIMKSHNYGRIVNVSSQAGQLINKSYGVPCYRVSKTTLNAVTRVFSDEMSESNVLVNSVCPVWAKTEMGGKNATRDAKDSIDTIIWAATLPDGGPTGKFFQEHEEIPW
jgi:NAD(P)-dependent dehydrogenase (short-subunit alcohol dehydrogenase family)